MKNGIYFILYFILILEINSNFLRLLPTSSENPFDYSTIKSNVTNQNIIGAEYIATNADQSWIYITDSNRIINQSTIIKSGASSNLNNSELYGVNSAILVNGGSAKVDRSLVTTSSEGSNGITCTNKGPLELSRTHVVTLSSFSKGFLSTFGGSFIGKNVSFSTSERLSPCLAIDNGEGSIDCEYCRLLSRGVESPLIYSTGDVNLRFVNGTAHNSIIAILEGKNSISFKGPSHIRANGRGRMGDDNCGVLIFRSQQKILMLIEVFLIVKI